MLMAMREKYRKKFLRKMVTLGFLNSDNAPIPEVAEALPQDLETPSADVLNKTIVLFHDETTFQACDYERTQWGTKGDHMLVPNSRGSGIMVSDFIGEKDGYLKLIAEEFGAAKQKYPEICEQKARAYLEYGVSKEGYWTLEKFINQIKNSALIAEFKYPKEDGYRVV